MLDPAGLTRFSNKRPKLGKNAPSLSGVSRGQITRRVGISAPGNPPMEKDERPVRNKIEKSRRPLNYGAQKPKYKPDQPDTTKRYNGLDSNRANEPNAPVIKKNVTRKPVAKPKRYKGNRARFGASRA